MREKEFCPSNQLSRLGATCSLASSRLSTKDKVLSSLRTPHILQGAVP